MDKNGRIHAIIHSSSAAAAGVGAGLAQLPGADAPILTGIQTTMIKGIAKIHGFPLVGEEGVVEAIIATGLATMVGRVASQLLIGWIPGVGNAINASTAAAITEGMGWAADAYFEEHAASKSITAFAS